jgi:acyl carrier protein
MIIADQLDVNISRKEIDPYIGLLEDGLGLDSIAIVELITLVEENFGFEFDEDGLNMDAFQSVRSLAAYIQDQLEPELIH